MPISREVELPAKIMKIIIFGIPPWGHTLKSYWHEAKKWVSGLEANFHERSLCVKFSQQAPALHSKVVLKHS